MKLGDYLKSLNKDKTPMKSLDDDFDSVVKSYTLFVVNKCMSYFPDTVIQSNNMNINSHICKEMHYDYLLYSIRKRSRFSSWLKREDPVDLEAVKKYFGYSDRKAREIMDILSDEDIKNIKDEIYEGGRSTR